MKKFLKNYNAKKLFINGLMGLVLVTVNTSVSTACFWLLYQPKMPDELVKK